MALPNFANAVANVLAGTGYAKVLCAGDSTTWGKGGGGSNPPVDTSYPARLKELIQSAGVPCSFGLNCYGNADPADARWTVGSGWAIRGALTGFGNTSLQAVSGALGTVSFAPGYLCDAADIYYAQNNGLGAVSVSVDDGESTALPTAGGAGIAKATITFPSGSGHNIVFSAPTGGDWYLCGVDCYDSTSKNVRVSVSGVSGSNSGNWADSSNGFSALNAIRKYEPDLTIISLGINDARFNTPVSGWAPNIAAIISAAQESGDVLLVSVIPSEDAGYFARELEYAAYSPTFGVDFADLLNDLFVDFQTADANGWMSDDLHGSGEGYQQEAQFIFSFLGISPPAPSGNARGALRLGYTGKFGVRFVPRIGVNPTTNFTLRNWIADTSWVYDLDGPQIDVPPGVVLPEPSEGSLGTLVITGGDPRWARGRHLIDGHGNSFDTGDGVHNMVHLSEIPMFPNGETTGGHFYRDETVLTKLAVFDGNSITKGNANSYFNSYPQQWWNGNGSWRMRNQAVGGQTTIDMISRAEEFVDAFYDPVKWGKNILLASEMTNDRVVNNATAAQAIDHFTTYCQGRMSAGWKFIVGTVLPRTEGSFTPEFMEECNAFLRDPANIGVLWHAVADFQADPRLGTTDLNEEYYVPGGIHPNDSGSKIMAQISGSIIASL